jgi:putative inorganic carbon (HCO3(-)) transporter
MTVLNVACLYFTGSRGAWLGLVSMVVVFLLLVYVWCRDWLSPFWQAWLLPMAAVGLGASLFLAVVLFEPLRLRVTSIFSGRDDSSNNFRINVWQAVLRMIRDRPLSGIGPGNVAFNAVYPLYMKPKFSALSAYSIFLEIAVETGLFGILTFLWLLLVVLNQGWVQLQRLHQQDRIEGFWLIGAIASVMGFLGQGLFDTVWYRPQVNTLWWLTIALVASYFVPSKHSEGLDASG